MNDNDDLTPLDAIKKAFQKNFDFKAGCVATGAATAGRVATGFIETTSFCMQTGAAKTVKDAIKLNFNGKNPGASYKGGAALARQAFLSSASYYGLGFAVMKAHEHDPILVQAAWAMLTVFPEQVSVFEAAKNVRTHSNLSMNNISWTGWWRINVGFFLRHLYGNPATLAIAKIAEKELEKVVPEKYHPISSFFAGPIGVWLTHRAGYSFLVATSVQLMVNPEISFKQAWKNAASGNFIKAGDVRALGRMGTIGVAFSISKIYDRYFSKDKPDSSEPTPTVRSQHATLFARSAVNTADKTFTPLILSLSLLTTANADCHLPINNHDALASLLQQTQSCPRDVFALHQLLKKNHFNIQTTLVANRGFHNPSQGSFSLFEIITGKHTAAGDFFIGHFTALTNAGFLTPDQEPRAGALMIEAFAFDPVKGFYNFYELRGDGQTGQWFYRGDTADIYEDNMSLHRQEDPAQPQFGTRLRCSGCHLAGGPIMKELAAPHNDWWEPIRKLDFGGHQPDAALQAMLTHLVAPDVLAKAVENGVKKLNHSRAWQKILRQHTLQEQLRPLFCPMELNLESDLTPNADAQEVQIPAAFFVDPQLLPTNFTASIRIARERYQQLLTTSGSHFPETNEMDADHAWLTPVKARSDQLAVTQLINRKLITQKFALSVLFIDMGNPIFSDRRCELLRYVPEMYTSNWQAQFIQNLLSSYKPAALDLVTYLRNDSFSTEYFQKWARDYLLQVSQLANDPDKANEFYQLLLQRREQIKASEISKNPKGQILEPGFRVIFPDTKTV